MRTISDLSLDNLRLDVDDDGIATVTLNRPAKRNALDAATIEELIDVFSTLPRAGVRACVLRGEGTHFSAGLDLVAVDGDDEVGARREVPVDGGDADAGRGRDVAHGYVDSGLDERGSGRGQ